MVSRMRRHILDVGHLQPESSELSWQDDAGLGPYRVRRYQRRKLWRNSELKSLVLIYKKL